MFISISRSNEGSLSDNNSDSGLCVVLNAANLAQLSPRVLTKSGIENLIHEMIQKNQDRSLLNHLRNEITSLILALSQKKSSWCFDDALVIYPSLFHSINDNSSKSGYSSNQLSSSTTADSDWQLREKKFVCTSSDQSVSDTVSQSTADQSAFDTVSQWTADQFSSDYTTNSVRQNSNDDDSNHGNSIENDSKEDCMEICNLDSSESENQQFKGQFRYWFAAKFSNSEKFPHSNTTVYKGFDYDKNGKRYKTREGLTRLIHYTVTRRNKMVTDVLNSRVCYFKFTWAKFNTNEYTKAIQVINDCYKKMLMIGKSKEVFRLSNNKVPKLLSAKTYSEFTLAKDNIERRYKRYLKLGGVKLNIKIPTELVPNPKNYTKKTSLPTLRSVLVREEILHHEYHMKNLNVLKCEICLEVHIMDGHAQQAKKLFSCQKCCSRKDPMYFLRNNLHPVWYEVSDDGELIRDKNGNKVPHFEIPVELKRLTMAEKFLIRRCSNYVPSVHLSNGTFALKGHCVTFPQDISSMCKELPLRKETMLVFIRYLGNKDTCAVYPKSLRVNRKKVIEALDWLKKHNPLYSDITIRESNLDWMQGEEEVSIASNAEKFQTKNSKHIRIISGEEPEFVSHSAQQDNPDDDDIVISTMHANQPNPLPSKDNANIIHSIKNIAQATGQVSQIMNFPPIDHDSPIWYVRG
jgi:hypothetical protein